MTVKEGCDGSWRVSESSQRGRSDSARKASWNSGSCALPKWIVKIGRSRTFLNCRWLISNQERRTWVASGRFMTEEERWKEFGQLTRRTTMHGVPEVAPWCAGLCGP